MTLRRSNSRDLHYAQQIIVLNPPTRAEHASLASEHLASTVRNRLQHIQHRPDLITGFLAQTGLTLEPEPP